MIYTNNYKIPETFRRAIENDDYDLKGCPSNVISLTSLIDSIKIKILRDRYDNNIIRDLSQSLWKLDGSAVHYVLERANKSMKSKLSEFRWFLNTRDWTVYFREPMTNKIDEETWYDTSVTYVSGKVDNVDEKWFVEDYKRTSVWSAVNNPNGKFEHRAQINIHVYALRKLQFPIVGGRVVMWLKDHKENDVKGNYPPIPLHWVTVPLRSDEEVEKYIMNRVKLYLSQIGQPDNTLVGCTSDERWYADEKFAVMKKGNKRAVRLFDPEQREEAEKFIAWKNIEGLWLDRRIGKNKRCCVKYCDVCEYCDFHPKLGEEGGEDEA